MSPNKQSAAKPGGSFVLRLGTLIFTAASILLLAFFIYTYIDPYHPFNPFPPPQPTTAAALSGPTGTSTPTPDPSPTPSLTPIPSDTPLPTAALIPSATAIPFPTATRVVLNTPAPSITSSQQRYIPQAGTPSYLGHSSGCTGLYLAGNITDAEKSPVMLMNVRVTGTLGGEEIYLEALSGSSPQYTASGWEIKLSESLIPSSGSLVVALYEQGGWEPISDSVVFDTFNDCSRNLVVVNFVQE
jgi:hypothetical protein